MFKKVLVANRGEIAVRVIRSLKEMGIKTVAIYSTADRDSLHVQLADEAVCVGGPQPTASYLNLKNILAAAVGTGAQAIHPGYGFLSESAEFAQMCTKCGLTFIGPNAETIDQMGNKEHARQLMIKNHVPVTPGSQGFITSVTQAEKIAAKVGYPVLLKAAAGGGGKGIRQVSKPEEMANALASAQAEAKTDFGDDRMYLEKVMQNVKHIEVQIFRDKFGQTVYFPERDCSLQRNKQKVLEESPCNVITEQERTKLGKIAVQAAEAAGYFNTGTIEFLMDQDHNFYFMEMNTRIQVEHTVTEMVTGVDLVKAQIKVAAGEKLPFTQEDLKIKGHAIECRINAEDPANNFMPSVGDIDFLYLPIGNPGMRIDTALYQGEKISPFYDSMIAKIVAFGQNRTEAIEKMKRLLNEMVIRGINTNQDFHSAILSDPDFVKGLFTNTYLEKEFLPKWRSRSNGETISA
ncbi:acetyl-CoA carboxylase biotin carboxylase subunit [Lactobacillus sp. PV037]|uniref:acetyl-CoA carboxylase biotin carboxylase subunit n=1 Tax=Lactobacillus sp. PV037 TaxID=2594496 RepID=UPI00223F8B76|nr:acetyl-CoA carboxylase biotin carboxylase subunit [Lactobacillus sp. PV037]QNQ83934.1 acetyl-CoA carboxylase biotin carboxylase subunit [Lactobacillus sp. PV037]